MSTTTIAQAVAEIDRRKAASAELRIECGRLRQRVAKLEELLRRGPLHPDTWAAAPISHAPEVVRHPQQPRREQLAPCRARAARARTSPKGQAVPTQNPAGGTKRLWRERLHPLLWWTAFIAGMYLVVDASIAPGLKP